MSPRPIARPQPRVLVIGRRGRLARCLAALEPSDVRVVFADRNEVDVADPRRIAAILRRVEPSVIVNTAGVTDPAAVEEDPETALAVNGHGAGHVAYAAQAIGAAVLQVSTEQVFDGRLSRPWRETDEPHPTTLIGATKFLGEELALQANPRTVILRTGALFAPWGDCLLARVLRGAGLGPDPDRRISPTAATDLARLCLWIAPVLAVSGPSSRIWGITHCASAGSCTEAEFAQAVARHAAPGLAVATDHLGPALVVPGQRAALDCSRLASVFGHRLPHWETSLRESLAAMAPRYQPIPA